MIRVAGASGFWGDSAIAVPQLLAETIDYLTFDYLAEITMSILARARAKDPDAGYAADFVTLIGRHLETIAARGIKVLANAGGVNPAACARALEARIVEAGLSLKVAVVTGDDLITDADALRAAGITEMTTGAAMPDALLSLNAYLGATPIAAALGAGADIVVTGRCVDSALALGACIHAFGWKTDDFDRLSAGSLAGHIIECGAQATGGIHTDWEETGDWANIGYPIVEIAEDGSFTVTKPAGTGGLVSVGTVAEQLVYEIGDPRAYLLPDVRCDWSEVTIRQTGSDRVAVEGARGGPPTGSYKASATWQDGFRVGAYYMIGGIDAVRKAERVADAVLRRTEAMLKAAGLPPYNRTSVEIIGSETSYGAASRARGAREVMLKLAACHPQPKALELLVREFTSAGTSMAPGFTGMGGNRPKVTPVVRLFSCLIPKGRIQPEIGIGGVQHSVPGATVGEDIAAPAPVTPCDALPAGATETVPLIALAFARSGDKGNNANIGVIARHPDYLPFIRAALTPQTVAAHFAHYLQGPDREGQVERFDLTGVHGLNFLLHDVLDGGGIASLRNDPQGKAYAQILLDVLVPVTPAVAEAVSSK